MYKYLFYNYYSKSSLINRCFSQELIDCRHPRGLCGRRVSLPIQELQGTWVQPLGQEDPVEKELATHSSILAWKIPRAEEHASLQYMWSQRFRHN